jgi:hypothetical protein
MNNEPVAWTACLNCGKRVTSDSIHTCSPQLKTLTDKEIVDINTEFLAPKGCDIYTFARAILKKAQE